MTREPKDATKLSARLARAYPSLSIYSAATLAEELCRIERAQRRHAERCCSGEDGGYVRPRQYPGPAGPDTAGSTHWRRNVDTGRFVVEHDPDAEARAEKRIEARCSRWLQRLGTLNGCNDGRADDPTTDMIQLQGDPRGPVLLLQLPGEGEAVAV